MAAMQSESKKTTILPIILAGGVGSRLWPLSREAHPKPFIKLDDGQSLIQKAYLRVAALEGVEEIVTVANQVLFFYTKGEYDALTELVAPKSIFHSFLLEPFGRNSSAAIALAAHYAQAKYGDDCVLLVLPADHIIENQQAFETAVYQATQLAQKGKLVTFGIQPSSPHTGFGYIEAEGDEVLNFVEKPDLTTAKAYLKSGRYFWNSGMFCMCVRSIMNEMQSHCAPVLEQSKISLDHALKLENHTSYRAEIQGEDFNKVADISIDYAVFEKSQKVAIVVCDFGWSDIGSWSEYGQLHQVVEGNNHVHGEKVVLEDVQDCIIHADHHLVAGIGLRNLIIADTSDALLVIDKEQVQNVSTIVKKIKEKAYESYKKFPTVYCPWGSYTVLQEGVGFKIKRIEVKVAASLSLQSHRQRSEHWVVVNGIAEVVNGDDTIKLEKNQSAYIPVGNKHRLGNIGQETLVLIEVQCGDYLGEDDIVRYQDNYGRLVE